MHSICCHGNGFEHVTTEVRALHMYIQPIQPIQPGFAVNIYHTKDVGEKKYQNWFESKKAKPIFLKRSPVYSFCCVENTRLVFQYLVSGNSSKSDPCHEHTGLDFMMVWNFTPLSNLMICQNSPSFLSAEIFRGLILS